MDNGKRRLKHFGISILINILFHSEMEVNYEETTNEI